MRVVADSNIFVSAILFGGKPAALLQAAEDDRCQLVVSEPILSGLAEVFARKFEWSDERVASSVARIRAAAELTVPTMTLSACTDPDDNRILEAAVQGRADCIVTGDKQHLLPMGVFRGIEILTVSEFLRRLEAGNLGRQQ